MIRRRVAIGALIGVAIAVTVGASPASAHPLGNFSVNHAHALRFTGNSIVDDAVVDSAEIPTAQAERAIDVDGDGSFSPGELSAYGEERCEALLAAVQLTVDDVIVPFTLTDTSFEPQPGTAGLTTSRLECRLEAAVDFSEQREVQFQDRFELSRIGWREITAVGDGANLVDSSVPTQSISDGLRDYPVDLLSSPLDVRDASFQAAPGSAADSSGGQGAAASRNAGGRSLSEGGPLAGVVDRVSEVFDDLVGRRDLTLGVGLLAVGLAIVLGASHAVLPGHGKTVMAAYIAGRQGTARDAIIVGATVTATHTGGVLMLGLALTVSSSLAGETVLAWLGVASGLLIASLGASLLVASARHKPSALHSGLTRHGHHHHGPGGHTHGPHVVGQDQAHDHGHDHRTPSPVDHGPDDGGHRRDRRDGHGHDHDHGHDHGHGHDHDHDHDHTQRDAQHDDAHGLDTHRHHDHAHGLDTHRHDDHTHGLDAHRHDDHTHGLDAHRHDDHTHGLDTHRHDDHTHTHGDHGHDHGDHHTADHHSLVHSHGHSNGATVALAERPQTVAIEEPIVPDSAATSAPPVPRLVSRRALVGMGVAGGLVPSPSALVVLLSAIALGRTAFGVLLIVGYGLGMAATLTAAGLLLVRVRDRYERRAAGRAARGIGAAAARWQKVMPFATAGLVLFVGLGLVLRSVNQLG